MNLSFTKEEIEFRNEVRSFFATAMPEDMRKRVLNGQKPTKEDLVSWHQILDQKGWAVPSWPKRWGGTGWNAIRHYIFNEELLQAPALAPLPHVNQVGAVILSQGTDEQKQRFLPKLRNLEWWPCQGFSEPGSGSDLASLKTRAERLGDCYLVNGQKVWTSQAHRSDWMYTLVRTSSGSRKQEGISYLLIDLKSPGITVRPIETIDSFHHFNEVFLNDVRVPVENRLGEENKGWAYAKHTLGHERVILAGVGLCKYRIRAAKNILAEGNFSTEFKERLHEKLALLEVQVKAMEMTTMRVISEIENEAHAMDAKPSILKLKGSDLQQETLEVLLELAGPGAMRRQAEFYGSRSESVLGDEWIATAAPAYFYARAASIYGGSSEIQKNIIAKRVLSL